MPGFMHGAFLRSGHAAGESAAIQTSRRLSIGRLRKGNSKAQGRRFSPVSRARGPSVTESLSVTDHGRWEEEKTGEYKSRRAIGLRQEGRIFRRRTYDITTGGGLPGPRRLRTDMPRSIRSGLFGARPDTSGGFLLRLESSRPSPVPAWPYVGFWDRLYCSRTESWRRQAPPGQQGCGLWPWSSRVRLRPRRRRCRHIRRNNRRKTDRRAGS
jgi:hypothetical protein